jgi:hypothetical protein
MRNSSLLVLEIIWIATGVLSIAAGIRFAVITGWSSMILMFALMAVISFVFAWLRHKQRKKS